jgi:multiple antibiotic resistance protein
MFGVQLEQVIQFLQVFGMSFVPLFVAMDAIGTLPFLLPIMQGVENVQRKRVVKLAMLTALLLGLGFVVVGRLVLYLMGIQISDFLVAGGLILMLLAAKDLVTGRMFESDVASLADAGVVPLGTPLIVGPAVLTTLLVLVGTTSVWIVVVAFILNLLITWLIFSQANRVVGFLGRGGVRATSKVASLLLAAIAIKMIRQGIMQIISGTS